VAGPFELEVIGPGEGDCDLFAFEFVEDDAVVDAVDGGFDAVAIVEELIAAFDELGDTDGADAVDAFGADEVAEGFLVLGVDFEEDDVFGGVAVEDGFTEEVVVGGEVEAGEEVLEVGVEIVGAEVLAGHFGLIGVEAGEALDFDELGSVAAGVVNDTEIGLDEEGLAGFVGDAVLRGDFMGGGGEVGGVGEELGDEFAAGAGHLLEEVAGEEAGGFGVAEIDGPADGMGEGGEEVLVLAGSPAAIEVFAEGGEHGLVFDEEVAVAHDEAAVGPDVELAADDVDVGGAKPIGAGMSAVGVAEGDMAAGDFFILEDIADDVGEGEVGADGEFADAVGIFVGVAVGPEFIAEFLVGGFGGDEAIFFDADGEWGIAEVAVFGAEVIADDAIDDEDAIDFTGRGEALAAREIAPLIGGDDAGGFEPLIAGVHVGDDVGAVGGFAADLAGGGGDIADRDGEGVDFVEVGAHALEHDAFFDIDHVGVAHAAAVDDVGHLHAAVEFALLGDDGEEGDLGLFHVFEDGGGHVGEGAGGVIFKAEGIPLAAEGIELVGEGGGDLLAGEVGDEGDAFGLLNAEAGMDGVVGAGGKLGVE